MLSGAIKAYSKDLKWPLGRTLDTPGLFDCGGIWSSSPCVVAVLRSGDGEFPCAPAGRRVAAGRPPPQPAEEHDVLHPVLFSHGSHLLHPVHVHGEPSSTQPLSVCPVHVRTVGEVSRLMVCTSKTASVYMSQSFSIDWDQILLR